MSATITPIIALIISALSVLIVLFRNQKTDNAEETSKMTTVLIKLENIGTGISEIKAEMNNMKSDMKDYSARIIIAEQSLKQIWHQIDEIKKEIHIEEKR